MKVILFVVGLLIGSVISDDVLKKFESDGVVKDLKLEAAPEKLLPVSYPSGVSVEGIELTPTQVKDIPEVKLNGEEGHFYTLLFTDIDVALEKHPNVSEAVMWLVVNIEGKDFKSGQTKIEYVGSGPPKSSGIHRYVFLLFQQLNGKQEFDLPYISNKEIKGRLLSAQQLIADYKLKLEAGNFYFAQYDDYVPILHAQLGLSDLTKDEKIEQIPVEKVDQVNEKIEKIPEKSD